MTIGGTHALVTGGGSGIGLAVARALAGAGSQVTIAGRRPEALEAAAAAADGRLHPLTMDVTDEAQVTGGIARAVALRGPVGICIANAGIAEGRALHKTDTALWRRIMATNLDGAFWTIRECLPAMRAAGRGRVIAVSSIAGLRGLAGAAAYSASKHGMVGLVRALSEEYAGTRITFNAVCPGYTDTDIVTRNAAANAARTGTDTARARAAMVSLNRHGRLIDPAEVAAAVLWLCGPDAASVNGQAIEIAGGQV